MPSVNDIILDLKRIQNALDTMTIKGADNASLLMYAYNTCTNMIGMFEDALEQALNPPPQEIQLHEVTEDGNNANCDFTKADT